jgi:hypothetical protein
VLKQISILLILLQALACTANSREEKNMFFIKKQLNGIPCKVYFFKRWGTYEHPVKPIGPISYPDALKAKGYCRAWMCESGENDQFLFFESIRNSVELTPIAQEKQDDNQLHFYQFQNGIKGVEIPADKTLDRDGFLASLPNDENKLSHIQSSLGVSYRYYYSPDGKLKKVEIRNMDGELKILNY